MFESWEQVACYSFSVRWSLGVVSTYFYSKTEIFKLMISLMMHHRSLPLDVLCKPLDASSKKLRIRNKDGLGMSNIWGRIRDMSDWADSLKRKLHFEVIYLRLNRFYGVTFLFRKHHLRQWIFECNSQQQSHTPDPSACMRANIDISCRR